MLVEEWETAEDKKKTAPRSGNIRSQTKSFSSSHVINHTNDTKDFGWRGKQTITKTRLKRPKVSSHNFGSVREHRYNMWKIWVAQVALIKWCHCFVSTRLSLPVLRLSDVTIAFPLSFFNLVVQIEEGHTNLNSRYNRMTIKRLRPSGCHLFPKGWSPKMYSQI